MFMLGSDFSKETAMSEAINVAISGLKDSVIKIANAAVNLVNASSTGRLPKNSENSSTAFLPHDVITISDSAQGHVLGVRSTFRARDPAYVAAPDPNSPNANAAGLVAAPNVDVATELLNLKMAEITYRANAAVVKAEINNDKRLLDALK